MTSKWYPYTKLMWVWIGITMLGNSLALFSKGRMCIFHADIVIPLLGTYPKHDKNVNSRVVNNSKKIKSIQKSINGWIDYYIVVYLNISQQWNGMEWYTAMKINKS